MDHLSDLKLKPFVKWAGGKTQILNDLLKTIPLSFSKQNNCYFETFLGGGALFLSFLPKKAILNDSNAELINTWQIVQKQPEKLIQILKQFQKDYPVKKGYYEYRNDYNLILSSAKKLTIKIQIDKAALFIFLNKTCFNGLYRVNSQGKFNSPSNKSNKFNFDEKNLLAISTFLNKNDVTFFCGDFEKNLKKVQQGDLIYLDPPYDLLNKTSFVAYNKDKFLSDSQTRLAERFQTLHEKGCYLILSNHKTERILKLYENHHIQTVKVNRMINCKGNQRKGTEEVIVTNFYPPLPSLLSTSSKKMFKDIKTPKWYISLSEVKQKLDLYRSEIETINTLIGCSDFKNRFSKIIKKNTKTCILLIALMFAVTLQDNWSNKNKKEIWKIWKIDNPEFLNDIEINKIYLFIKEIGMVDLFVQKKISDVYDYLLGVKVGLDSNARKNRTGQMMEKEVNKILDIKEKNNFIDYFVSESTLESFFAHKNKKINWTLNDFVPLKNQSGTDWETLKTKRFDFIYKEKDNLFVVECNYYNVSGSKIDATIKQYKDLFNSIQKVVKSDNFFFVWISDGPYWDDKKWKKVLKDTEINLLTLTDFEKKTIN